MSDINEILSQLKTGILKLAKDQLMEFGEDAINDAENAFNKSKDRMEEWLGALKDGKLSKSDFEELARGEKSLWAMEVLAKKAEAKIAIDKFRESATKLLLEAADKIL